MLFRSHPVSVCSMQYLLWVAGSLNLYLCVPCSIYCRSQEASPCICVFHAVFTVGRGKPHPVSVCSMLYLLWVAGSLSIVSLLQKNTTFRTLAPLTPSGKNIEHLKFWSVYCNVTIYMCLFASLQAEPLRKLKA